MPQQGLWPWPVPLAGKWAGGGESGGGSGPRPPLAHVPVLASSVGPRLPGLVCPMRLRECGQQCCQGRGWRAWRRAGMVPCPGSSGIWLLLAHKCL